MAQFHKAVLVLLFLAGFTPGAMAKGYKGRLIPGEWENSWTPTLNESLVSSNLLDHKEAQIEKLCPGYKDGGDKRKLFWQQLMISLAWRESLHGPKNFVRFKGGTNDGLFQINPKLRSTYGCRGYNLFSPLDNIKCAFKMAAQLVKRYGSFLSGEKGGMAAYWQPLRATNSYNRKNRAFILATTTKACSSGNLDFLSQDFMDLAFRPAPVENTLEELGIPESELDRDEYFPEYEPDPFGLNVQSGLELGR